MLPPRVGGRKVPSLSKKKESLRMANRVPACGPGASGTGTQIAEAAVPGALKPNGVLIGFGQKLTLAVDELAYVGIRSGAGFLGGADENDAAVQEHSDAIGDLVGGNHVVGD